MKIPLNKKLAQEAPGGGWKLRVSQRKGRGKKGPGLLVRCGCCKESLEIHYGKDDEFVEVNGVIASATEWRKLLGPILFRDKAKKARSKA